MEGFPMVVLILYALIGVIAVVALIYFIAKRIENKKNETFEDRDN